MTCKQGHLFTAVAAFILHFIKDADGILKTDY